VNEIAGRWDDRWRCNCQAVP